MAGTLSGTVNDIRNMQPISGAAVTVNPGDHTTTTGADGEFSVSVDAGSHDLDVTKAGYDPWIAHGIVVLDDVDTDLPLVLHPSD